MCRPHNSTEWCTGQCRDRGQPVCEIVHSEKRAVNNCKIIAKNVFMFQATMRAATKISGLNDSQFIFFFYNILICILLSQALWDKRNSEKRAVNNCKKFIYVP